MRVANARDALAVFQPIFAAAAGEVVAVAYLGAEGELLDARQVGTGSVSEVTLPVRRIMEDALRLGAEGLIVAHNHPSGDLTPSRADIEATRELADVASRLGVRVMDHLIVGDEVGSLREMGFL